MKGLLYTKWHLDQFMKSLTFEIKRITSPTIFRTRAAHSLGTPFEFQLSRFFFSSAITTSISSTVLVPSWLWWTSRTFCKVSMQFSAVRRFMVTPFFNPDETFALSSISEVPEGANFGTDKPITSAFAEDVLTDRSDRSSRLRAGHLAHPRSPAKIASLWREALRPCGAIS